MEAKTGKQEWFYSTEGSWINNSVVSSGEVPFGPSTPGLLHAVKREHLRTSLGVEIKFPVFAAIATADGILYFGSLDGKLSVVDLKTQKPAWVFQNGTSQQKLPGIQNPDGTLRFGVIMSENFYDHMVAAVSRLLSVGSVLASPVVVKDVVYVGSTDGNLYALD